MELEEKARLIIDIVRKNKIETPFKVQDGTCYDYDKYVESTIAQLNAYKIGSLFWKTAYMRLYRLKVMINEKK